MPPAPKIASFPAIRGALKFYQICSVITGTFLLLLCAEMIVKYAFGHELFLGGSGGFLYFAPVIEGPHGTESSGDGTDWGYGMSLLAGSLCVADPLCCTRTPDARAPVAVPPRLPRPPAVADGTSRRRL